MPEDLKPYFLAALISHIAVRQAHIDQGYLNRKDTLNQIAALLDQRVPAEQMEWAFDALGDFGMFDRISDDFAGDFFKLNPAPADTEVNKQVQDKNSIIYKYRSVGPNFLNAVTERLANLDNTQNERLPIDTSGTVPASDRIVSLDHNQIGEFDTQISELVEEIEARDNGEPDHPGLRERLLGQIKAGQELIRAGQFRAYLLYEVLVKALGEIIEKYGNPSIKALANALLGAIATKILES